VHLKNLQQALPLIPAWNSANEAFAEVASTPDLDDEFVERRRQASIDLGIASRELDTIQSTIDGLTQQITSIDADPIVMHHSEEIESAFQEISAQRQADEERIESLRAQRALDSQIAALLQQLTGPSEVHSLTRIQTQRIRSRSIDYKSRIRRVLRFMIWRRNMLA
jgi:TolA-binding protein